MLVSEAAQPRYDQEPKVRNIEKMDGRSRPEVFPPSSRQRSGLLAACADIMPPACGAMLWSQYQRVVVAPSCV